MNAIPVVEFTQFFIFKTIEAHMTSQQSYGVMNKLNIDKYKCSGSKTSQETFQFTADVLLNKTVYEWITR